MLLALTLAGCEGNSSNVFVPPPLEPPSPPPSCPAERNVLVDFDFQGLPAGTVVSVIDGATECSGVPETVSPIGVMGTKPSLPGENVALLFDSSNPIVDFDLGTPNEDFGGPGVGAGGAMGSPFENSEPLFNLLIFAQDLIDADGDGLVDVPNDAFETGMVFEIDFRDIDTPFVPTNIILESVTLIDVGDGVATNPPPVDVRLFDATEALIAEFAVDDIGENGVVVLELDGMPFAGSIGVEGVAFMEVELRGSGAIDDITFTMQGSDDAEQPGER